MTTATLQPPSADTYIRQADTSNYDTSTTLRCGEESGATCYNVTLLKFNLSSIPANAVVSAATLSLYDNDTGDQGAPTTYCFRVLKNWVSASATRDKYNATDNWGAQGLGWKSETADPGDVAWPGLGSVLMSNQAADYEWQISLNVTTIQKMIDGTYPNYGFALMVTESSNNYHVFKSAEHADTTKRPKLVIEYTAAASVSSGFFF